MAVAKKIINYLEKSGYKYAIIEHKTTFTAWDTAQTEKVKPQSVAKQLVLRVDKDYVLALIAANRNLDKQKLLKVINSQRKKVGVKTYKKIDFAKELWMKKNIPGKVGATPPFRGLLKMEIYIDNLLAKNAQIYVGSGDYENSFLVKTAQYLKIEQPIKGVFSKSKK